MHAVTPGWATYGEDATVRKLEAVGAALLGHEACILVPTCAMANLVALLTLADEGAIVVVDEDAHVLCNESMAITEIARLRPRRVRAERGLIEPSELAPALAGAAVLWIENTHTGAGGRVAGVDTTRRLLDVARASGARVHVDGARLANAAVALGVPMAALAGGADSVSLSLNKGLSAPYGALLAGSGHFIAAARLRLRQLGGATVHKAGIAAAAGLVALRTMMPRLADDHRRARRLASLLDLDPALVETNIVFVEVSAAAGAVAALAGQGVLTMARDERRIRLVTHRLISDDDVEVAAAAVRAVARRVTRQPGHGAAVRTRAGGGPAT